MKPNEPIAIARAGEFDTLMLVKLPPMLIRRRGAGLTTPPFPPS
jgi:hypothetical protein